MERTAVCSCGQLSITIDGDPTFHGICSCFACQRESGSTFTFAGYWPKTAIREIRGNSSLWRRYADSGKWLDLHFCPICGCGLYSYAEFMPDMVNVTIGNFADPEFPPPNYAVWNKHKHPWVAVPASCQIFDEQPVDEAKVEPAQ